MSHTDEIFEAVRILVTDHKRKTFSRVDVKEQLGVTPAVWASAYTSMFQGMVEDCPPGAPRIAQRYRAVFKRISLGVYTLTPYGRSLLNSHGKHEGRNKTK